MAFGDPQPHAFYFEIENTLFHIDIETFEDFYNLEMRQRNKNESEWVYLIGVDFVAKDVETDEQVKALFKKAIQVFNKKIEELFPKGEVPSAGVEGVKQRIKTGLVFKDGKIALKD